MENERIDEAIIYLKTVWALGQATDQKSETFLLAIKDVLDYIDSHCRWIPVTERLPEVDGGVLVVWKDGDIGMVFYKDNKYWDYVTHWMPLPEPPKEVE